ncbi:MAG: hypothetical protein KDD25_09540 [Bdellovibrionales bacterium]|nr:hypothetical protein [Bdellovibrionales bacterium]
MKISIPKLLLIALVMISLPAISQAEEEVHIAQYDDNFDPFVDYSEFEQVTEEEADINFFRNGRFLAIGAMFGYRFFTNILGEIYEGAGAGGVFLSYFFDLRFAIQISYLTGDHRFKIDEAGKEFFGTITVSQTAFDIKYYLNTQNVTRGLASVNPYLIFGLAQVFRTSRFDDADGFARDAATSFHGGLGIEFPMMRNKMFFGLEGTYQYVNFQDESNELVIDDEETGVYPRGDIVKFLGIIGINF